jgi:hypothetical protein
MFIFTVGSFFIANRTRNVPVKELDRLRKTVVSLLILLLLLSSSFYLLYLVAQENQKPVVYVISMSSNVPSDLRNAVKLVNRLLYLNQSVYWVAQPLSVLIEGEEHALKGGDFIIPLYPNLQNDIPSFSFLSQKYLEDIFEELHVPIKKTNSNFEALVYSLKYTKVAVFYGGGVTGGTLEHIHPLEDAGFSVGIVREENLSRESLAKYDVVTFPGGGPYDNYLSQEDMEAIKDFVNNGGGFLGTCGGSILGIRLGLLDAEPAIEGQYEAFADLRGPLLLNLTASSMNPIVFGYSSLVESEYFCGPFISRIGNDVETVGSYHAKTDNLYAYFPEIFKAYNYTPQPEVIDDFWETPAIIAGKYGSGKAVLSAVHPEIMPVSQRLFFNSIYYLSCGNQFIFSTLQHSSTQKVSNFNLSNEALGIINEAVWSQLRSSTSTLINSASRDRGVLMGLKELNMQLVGLAGEYLQLFLDDIQNRSTTLLTKIEELHDAYRNLEVDKTLLKQMQPLSLSHSLTRLNLLSSIEELQRRILKLQESFSNLPNLTHLMDTAKEELLNEKSLLQQIESENSQDNQYYQNIMNLHAAESLTLVKVKDEVDYYLLQWTFEAESILTEANLLNYASSLV